MKKIITLCFLMALVCVKSWGQVVSTNSSSGLNATYPDLVSAITALNSATITAPVTITLNTGNPQAAPSAGYIITATGTAANPITINGASTGSTVTAFAGQASGVKTDAVFKIVGGDYITLQGFDIKENSANTITAAATNNMTEFGIGIFLTTATNGTQNNTIQNNTISLGLTYQNAIGIFSTSSSSQTNGTLAATSTAGTNSNNKFYSNTISNVAYGMYFISEPITATINESGIDIGGSSASTANTITFGNAILSDIGFNRFSAITEAGIYFRNGVGDNVRYNNITSNNLSFTAQSNGVAGVYFVGGGTTPTGVTYTSTINNNTVTLTNTGTTAMTAVDFGAGISTGTIIGNTNNIILNQTVSSTNSSAIVGVKANYPSANITANVNTVIINQTTSGTGTTSSALTGINISGTGTTNTAQSNTITINQTTSSTSAVTSAVTGISAILAATTLNIGSAGNANIITIKQAVTGSGSYGSGAITYINANATHATANIVNNTLNTTGSTIRSTGTLIGVFQDATVTSLVNIKSNTLNIDRVALSGAVSFTTTSGTPSEVADTISLNSITFTNLSGTTSVTAISSGGGPGTPGVNNKSISNNTINISGTHTGTSIGITSSFTNTGKFTGNTITISSASPTVTGVTTTSTAATISGNILSLSSSTTSPTAMTGLSVSGSGTHSITGNTFSAMNFTGVITAAPVISAIAVSGNSGANVFSNVINNISVGAAGSTANPVVDGILISGGLSVNVYRNKIYGITTAATGTSTVVNGIRLSGGTTNNVYNNLIGNLTTPSAASIDAVRGISITSTTATSTNNIYYNTIYLNATSTGTNFGTSGIYHAASTTSTTAKLDLKNNIIVNISTANGTGFTVAFRRSVGTAGALANYNNTSPVSNYNDFYAGSPSSANLIYYDGTSSAQTLAQYKNGVFTAGTIAPRDANSITENPPFLSTNGTSSDFLHINTTIGTQIESGGTPISGYADDYDANGIRSATTPDIGADEFTGTLAAAMTYVSSTTTQTSIPACVGKSDVQIIGIQVVTAGAISPLTLNSFVINPKSTVLSDIASYRIYYTSTTATFSTGNPVIPATTGIITGDNTVTPSTAVTLAQGTNYFWLVYNLSTTATGPLDAQCNSLTLSSGTVTPTVTDPAGSVTVNALPTVTVSPTSTTYCVGGAAIPLTASGASTYAWTPAGGLSATTDATVNASPSATTTYTVTGTDGNGCANTAAATVSVSTTPTGVTATATPATICSGSTSNLTSSANTQNTAALANSYTFSGAAGTYATISGTTLGSTSIGDDVGVGNLPIGFTFNYSGTAYTVFGVSSNGFIQLGNTTAAITGFSLNSLAGTAAILAPLWDDNNTTGGTIIYSTTGTAPNRILTVQWTGMQIGGGGATGQPTINVQLQLSEATGAIKYIYGSTSAVFTSTTASIGISGAIGNYISVTPLSPPNTSITSTTTENSTISSATNFPSGTTYTFTPSSFVLSYAWAPTALVVSPTSQNTTTTALTADQQFTLTVTNAGCFALAQVTVAVTAGIAITSQPATTTKCANSTATFSVSATGAGLTYQWYKNGIAISTAANASATTATLTLTNIASSDVGSYYVMISTTCGSPVNSNPATLTVNALPTVAVNPTTASYCGTTPVTLNASGASTYAWSPASGLSSASGATVTASPSATTTYTVTGTDANTCTNTAQTTITVGAAFTATATATPAIICSGSNSQLNVTANAPASQSVQITEVTLYKTGTGQTSTYPSYLGSADQDYVEISNISGVSVDISGWTINDYTSSSSTAVHSYTFPTGSIIPATSVAVIQLGTATSSSADLSNRFFVTSGTNAYWFSDDLMGIVLKNGSTVIDAVGCGSGYTFASGTGVTSTYWSGYAPTGSGLAGAVRTASTDSNTGSDWTSSATITQSIGTYNGGYANPFSVASYAWTPSTYLSSTTIANPIATAVTTTTIYNVTVTSAAGCTATASTTVTLSAGGAITTPPSSISKCIGSTASFTVAATGPNLTYQWYKNGTAISSATNASAITATLTLNSITAGDAGNYYVIVGSSCGTPQTSGTATLTVNALPIVSVNPTSATYCSTPVSLTAGGASTYAWSPANGLSATTGSTVTATPSATTTYTVTGTDANTCVNTATTTITAGTVVTFNSVTASPAIVCSGSSSTLTAMATIPAASPVYCTPTVTSNPGATGDYLNNFTFANITNNNSGDAASDYTYYSALTANVVANGTTSYTISLTAGGTSSLYNQQFGIWIDLNQNGTFESNEFLFATATPTYSPTSATGTITIPTTAYNGITRMRVESKYGSTAVANSESCTFSGYGEYEDYNVSITGGTTNPGTAVSSSNYTWSPSTFLNTTTGSIVTASNVTATTLYTVTASQGGCSASGNVTLTVNPNATLTLTSVAGTDNQPVCAGSSLTTITYSVGGGGTSASITSGTLPSGVTGTYNSTTKVFTISGTPAATAAGTYNYTVTTTGTCTQTSLSGTITVNPLPLMINFTSAGNQYYCTPPADGFTIDVDATEVGVNYQILLNGSPVAGDSIRIGTGNPYVFGDYFGAGTYTVRGTNATTGCTKIVTNAPINLTIRQRPTDYNLLANGSTVSAVSICSNTSVIFSLDGSQNAVTYRLTRDGTQVATANGTGNAISFTVQTAAGVYRAYVNSTCGFEYMIGTYTVTVNPAPSVTGTYTPSICSGSTFTVNPTSSVSGTTYTWGVPAYSGSVSGGSAQGTGQTSVSGTLTNNGVTSGTAAYTVTPTTTTCTGNTFTVTVTVAATLANTSVSAVSPICSGQGTTVSFSGAANSTVTYTINGGSNQTVLLNASGQYPLTVPSLTTTTTYALVSAISGTNSSCTQSLSGSATVVVNPLPTLTSTGSGSKDQSVCRNNNITPITYTATGGAATLTITGTLPGLTVTGNNTSTITISGTPTSVGNNTYTITTNNGSCGTASISGTITLQSYLTWTGTQNANWSNANNWCSNTIPSATDDVVIAAGTPNNPVLPADITVKSLTINSGATVDNDGHTLTADNVTGSGSITGSATSNLVVNNTSTLNFTTGFNILKNLTINGGTVTLGNDLNITAGASYGIVTVANGAILATGGHLTLKSDINGTAAVAANTSATAYITGNVTAERYIPLTTQNGGRTGRAWRMLTAPVTGTTIGAAWQENMLYDGAAFHTIGTSNTVTPPSHYGTMITGYAQGTAATANGNGYDFWSTIANSSSSIRSFQFTSGTTTTGSWLSLSNISGKEISDEKAYMLFVRGDRSTTTGADFTTLRATGTLKQLAQSVSIDRAKNFLVAGNPFPSTIDWSSIYQRNKSFIQDKFVVWNSKLSTYGAYVLVQGDGNGTYSAVPLNIAGTTVTTPTVRFIPSGAGFFVYPQTGGSGTTTLSITEADKNAGQVPPAEPFRLTPETDKKLWVNLNLRDSDTSAILADGVMARFDASYTAAVDGDDALKVTNFNENLGINSADSSLMVEARPDVQKTDTLHLKLWNVTQRNYQLQMLAANWGAGNGVHAYLEDSYLGTKQEVSLSGEVTTVGFSVTGDATSYAPDRFRIVFQNDAVVLPVRLTKLKAAPVNGGVNVTWTVTNEVNMKGYTVERSTDGGQTYSAVATQVAKNTTGAAFTDYQTFDAAPHAGDNLYRIRIETGNGAVTYSAVVKVTFGTHHDIQITLYPNPVRSNGKVNLQLSYLVAGNYLVSVYSEAGQTVYQRKVTIAQPNTTQSEELKLGSGLAQGSYQVRLTDSKGVTLYTDKLVVGR